MPREIPNANEIEHFMHCRRCLEEKPPDISPQNFARLDIGFTPLGLQVWCLRHDCNVVHIDFEGQKHPANVTQHVKTAPVN